MTEELIKAALTKQAERAPHPGPVLHALAGERRSSRKSLVVGLVAALVAVLALGATALMAPSQPEPPPVGFAERELAGLPMGYDLGWLPDGYVETDRSTSFNQVATRTWTSGESTISLMVQSRRAPGLRPVWVDDILNAPPDRRTTVRGQPGMFEQTGEDNREMLSWLPNPDYRVSVMLYAVPEPQGLAQRLADSAEASADVLTPEFQVGLPPERVEISVRGSAPSTATTTVSDFGYAGNWREFDATITDAPAPGGYEVMVRGVRGTFVPFQPKTGAALSVPVGEARWLVFRTPAAEYGVQGPGWESALVPIAEQVVLNSKVDLSWVGTR
ncbi:hypothetical protein [Amycolatopsis sp. 195334CR]|uniref:hypothetical protein n=1 Tax=Amycolatopsis sp. 195334CR TaxID=2814588 RepID=UPI001A8DA423|nr:hypothetical protein [Amycolatopsis sp. 195334CR]MBN6035770.1 hypothetical protein [Amycolatopsis sp. 195334CR]